MFKTSIDIQSPNEVFDTIEKENLAILGELRKALNEVEQIQSSLQRLSKKQIKLEKQGDLWGAEIVGVADTAISKLKPTATEALAELVRTKPSYFGVEKISEVG